MDIEILSCNRVEQALIMTSFESLTDSEITASNIPKIYDDSDELAQFRSQFIFPKNEHTEKPIYLCGNSLGLQPVGVQKEVMQELTKWGNEAVEGHFTGTYS